MQILMLPRHPLKMCGLFASIDGDPSRVQNVDETGLL